MEILKPFFIPNCNKVFSSFDDICQYINDEYGGDKSDFLEDYGDSFCCQYANLETPVKINEDTIGCLIFESCLADSNEFQKYYINLNAIEEEAFDKVVENAVSKIDFEKVNDAMPKVLLPTGGYFTIQTSWLFDMMDKDIVLAIESLDLAGKKSLASRKKTSPSTLAILAKDKSLEVVARVVSNRNTPQYILAALSESNDDYILSRVFKNPNLAIKKV